MSVTGAWQVTKGIYRTGTSYGIIQAMERNFNEGQSVIAVTRKPHVPPQNANNVEACVREATLSERTHRQQ